MTEKCFWVDSVWMYVWLEDSNPVLSWLYIPTPWAKVQTVTVFTMLVENWISHWVNPEDYSFLKPFFKPDSEVKSSWIENGSRLTRPLTFWRIKAQNHGVLVQKSGFFTCQGQTQVGGSPGRPCFCILLQTLFYKLAFNINFDFPVAGHS